MTGRRACAIAWLRGNVLGSRGEACACGGENGLAKKAAALAELARRVLAFSARSALKMNSSGDSSLRAGGSGGLGELFSSESVVGGDSS